MTHAIIQTGGKQYKVKIGDTLKIEKIEANLNDEITLKEVLLLFDKNTKEVILGAPYVNSAEVKAKVLEQGRAKKVTVLKFKSKVRYKKKYGHRQPFSKIYITHINLKDADQS